MLPQPTRYRVALLAGVFAFALAVRLGETVVLQGIAAPPKGDANPDQLDYELFAAEMAAGNGYAYGPGAPTACRPPGTSFTLYPVYTLFGHTYAAARIWFCLLSAATCLLAWWAAYPVFGHRVGVLAAAIVAVYPGHFYYAMHFLSEVPASLALAVACGLAVRARAHQPGWRDFAGGAVWGYAVLVRPNFVLALGVVALVLALSDATWRVRLMRLALLGTGAVLVVAPWVWRNEAVMGKPSICTIVGGYTFWGANNTTVYDDPANIGFWVATSGLQSAEQPLVGTEAEREAAAWSYGKRYMLDHRDRLPVVVAHRVLRVVGAYSETPNRMADLAMRLGWFALLPFVALGLWRVRSAHATRVFVAPLLATLATAVVFYGCSRFRDACVPQLAAFAAVGMLAVVDRVRGKDASQPGVSPTV